MALPPGGRIKYYILAACLIGTFLGISLFGLFDPLSIAVRSFVLVVHSWSARALVALTSAFGWSGGVRAVRAALVVPDDPVFQLQALTLLVLAAVLGLGLVRRRFWCRYVCPLGAVYAMAGQAAATRRRVGEACTECGQCARACPMGCISPDGRRTLHGECTLCLQCRPACPTDAVRFFGRTPAEQRAEVDLTRRGVAVAVVSGLAAYPAMRMPWSWLHAKRDPLMRPPLAGRDPGAFLGKCLRCGQCMRACPTQVIQPAGVEAGLESLWTPKVAPRPGYCEYNCTACGEACPTGAIPTFTLDEKHATAIGLAFLDRSRCIPWRGDQRWHEEDFDADDHNCGVCEEVCPVAGKAIHFRRVYGPEDGDAPDGTGQELRLPYVRQEACIGCGYCQAVCPVEGAAAVRVTGGFRKVSRQPLRLPAPQARTAQALPAVSDELRLAGPKTTYQGAAELWDYINGAGEVYLRFNFVRVTAAEYTDGAGTLKVDLWGFETPDDAFGAFAKDRRGGPADVGDEGAELSGSVWARRGRFMIAVLNLGEVPAEQAKLLASTALDALEEAPSRRPAICRALPRERLDEFSVVFMRDELPLNDIYLADEAVPDGTLGIGGGAVGAYGRYDLRGDRKPAGLLLVEHPDAAAASAAAAADRFARLRRQWGEAEGADGAHVTFRAADDSYCVIASAGRRFAAAFFMPSAEAGAALVSRALQD